MKNYEVAFITNNSSKTREEICTKLTEMKIPAEPRAVYVNSVMTGAFLRENGIDNVYVIGSESLKSEIEKAGTTVLGDESAENLVVGFDVNFNYEKISVALTILDRGGRFIACNMDASFPDQDAQMRPANGAMVGAVSGAAYREPDDIVGKPTTYIVEKIMSDHDVTAQQTLVIGDSYESDILMAIRNKSKSVLIAKSSDHESKNVLIVRNLKELYGQIAED
tara:strand:- start:480 stop:1145 length:666 start_codon:yes stop_codon:yes gene_type:complete